MRLAVALVSEWPRWPPHVIKTTTQGWKIECFLVRELNITIPKKTPFFFFGDHGMTILARPAHFYPHTSVSVKLSYECGPS